VANEEESLDEMSTDFSLCYVTCPNQEVARDLCYFALDTRLAACGNILPGVTSMYRWKGSIEESPEVVLLLKTRTKLVAELQKLIEQKHPYETPCFLSFSIDSGLPAYLQWLASETLSEGPHK
jgi:periplasmic divalent cation tolerance protein